MFVQLLTVDGKDIWVNPAHVEMFCPALVARRGDEVKECVIFVGGEDYRVRVRPVDLARMLREAQP